MEWLTKHTELIFYILLAIALLLPSFPLIGKYFRSVNTLVHEAGHAFMTLALSGEVISVNLFADTSGTTVTKAKNKLSQVLIALAGYPFSVLTAWLFLFFLEKGQPLNILFILTSIALIIMVLSLRNTYGLFWAGTFVVFNLLIIYFDNKLIIYIAAAFYSLTILSDAVISSLVLLVLSIKQAKKSGDAANLQKITKIPAAIWAILILAFTLIIVWITVRNYFPSLNLIT